MTQRRSNHAHPLSTARPNLAISVGHPADPRRKSSYKCLSYFYAPYDFHKFLHSSNYHLLVSNIKVFGAMYIESTLYVMQPVLM